MTLREMIEFYGGIGIKCPAELQNIKVCGVNQFSVPELNLYLRSISFFSDMEKCFWEYLFFRDHKNLFLNLFKDDREIIHLQFNRNFFEEDDN